MPMLVHDMRFILATLPMDRQVIMFKTYINAILMLLIPLYAAGSDLPSLPAPFPFHRQLMVVVLVRCAGFRNISHYFLN